MPLSKQHISWMAPSLICYFIVILFYIEKKWPSDEKFNHKSKLYGKFQCFNAIDGSIKMLTIGWISKNFNWNEKL